MINADFTLKIVDFGMARVLELNRDRTKNVTHQFYSAPEVIFTKNYDFKGEDRESVDVSNFYGSLLDFKLCS